MVAIRLIESADWPSVWAIIEPTFRAGETCAFPPDISEPEAQRVWVNAPLATYVAEENGIILGTYYLKPNQPGLGAHVCNCGYVVDVKARGKGVASQLCQHSQREAVSLGFRAMQFNIVVSTNAIAVQLWQKLGFSIVGTLPGAFKHAQLGFVDALVMYKILKAE